MSPPNQAKENRGLEDGEWNAMERKKQQIRDGRKAEEAEGQQA